MIEYFAVAGAVGILASMMGAHLINYFRDQKEKRKFKQFDRVISGVEDNPRTAEKFFSGETKLQQEVYVIMPVVLSEEEVRVTFVAPIESLLTPEIGSIIRVNSIGDCCGFDVWLEDFIKGVDLLRIHLPQLDAPQGTVIEYSGGEFPIYLD